MAGVMEKVCAAEPVVSAAPKLKEELEGYKELLAQSGLLRERVKMMNARQEELERLLDETGTLVAQVGNDVGEFCVGSVLHAPGDSADHPVVRSVVTVSLLSHILPCEDVCVSSALHVRCTMESS